MYDPNNDNWETLRLPLSTRPGTLDKFRIHIVMACLQLTEAQQTALKAMLHHNYGIISRMRGSVDCRISFECHIHEDDVPHYIRQTFTTGWTRSIQELLQWHGEEIMTSQQYSLAQ